MFWLRRNRPPVTRGRTYSGGRDCKRRTGRGRENRPGGDPSPPEVAVRVVPLLGHVEVQAIEPAALAGPGRPGEPGKDRGRRRRPGEPLRPRSSPRPGSTDRRQRHDHNVRWNGRPRLFRRRWPSDLGQPQPAMGADGLRRHALHHRFLQPPGADRAVLTLRTRLDKRVRAQARHEVWQPVRPSVSRFDRRSRACGRSSPLSGAVGSAFEVGCASDRVVEAMFQVRVALVLECRACVAAAEFRVRIEAARPR